MHIKILKLNEKWKWDVEKFVEQKFLKWLPKHGKIPIFGKNWPFKKYSDT